MFTTVSSLIMRLPALDDARAWELFEQRYWPMLKHYFMTYCGDEDIATDLVQDTIRRAVEGLRDGVYQRDRGRLRDWIRGIARNMLRNHYRRTTHSLETDGARTQFWARQADPHAATEMAEAERRFDAIWVRTRLSALLRLAAQNFGARDLRCYFLVEIRQLPVKVVAERLGLSETAVFRKRRSVANWFYAVGPRFMSKWER